MNIVLIKIFFISTCSVLTRLPYFYKEQRPRFRDFLFNIDGVGKCRGINRSVARSFVPYLEQIGSNALKRRLITELIITIEDFCLYYHLNNTSLLN